MKNVSELDENGRVERLSFIQQLAEAFHWELLQDDYGQYILYTGLWETNTGELLDHEPQEPLEDEQEDYSGNTSTRCQSCGNSVVGEVFAMVNNRPLCASCIH